MQFLEQWSDIPTGHGLRAKFHLHNWRRGHQSIYQKFSWILDSQLFQLMIQNLNNSTLCFRGPILSHNCMIITRSFRVQSYQCLCTSRSSAFKKLSSSGKEKNIYKKIQIYGIFFSVHFSLTQCSTIGKKCNFKRTKTHFCNFKSLKLPKMQF